MKKISIKAGNIIRSMLAGAISLLGFAACDDPEDPDNGGGMVCMYGTPTGYYEIKGSVTAESGSPVENARVILRHINRLGPYTEHGDTVRTDSEGRYRLRSSGLPDTNIRIVCQPQSDTLEADSVNLTVEFKDREGIWNSGTARETVDFTLKYKKILPEN
mgnify:CR=1 FL=1